jgi:hypothetical protein
MVFRPNVVRCFLKSSEFIQNNGVRASSKGKASNVEAKLTFGRLRSTAIADLAKPHQLVQFSENRAISSAQKIIMDITKVLLTQ